jgi:hypothetical protein
MVWIGRISFRRTDNIGIEYSGFHGVSVLHLHEDPVLAR